MGISEERKRQLQPKLETIKELKREYYVGTMQAKDLLEFRADIATKPDEFSDRINQEIDYSDYKATPERISAIARCFEHFLAPLAMQDEDEPIYEPGVYFETLDALLNTPESFPLIHTASNEPLTHRMFFRKERDGMELSHIFDEDVFDFFVAAFENAKQKRVKTDTQMYSATYEMLMAEMDRLSEYVSEEEVKAAKKELRLAKHRGNMKFGTKQYVDLVILMDRCIKSDVVSYSLIVSNLKRDQVEHRLEYRRQVVLRFLDQTRPESYSEAVDFAEKSLAKRKSRYESFISLKVPKSRIDSSKRLYEGAVFLRQCLASEKRFVEKYLSS